MRPFTDHQEDYLPKHLAERTGRSWRDLRRDLRRDLQRDLGLDLGLNLRLDRIVTKVNVAKVINAVGRSCISLGTLTLLFVVYQLWGTGLREAQAQNRLRDEFADVASEPTHVTVRETTSPTFGPPPPPAAEGDAIARLIIPRIAVDKIVVEGTGLTDLQKGPGHFTNTPLPGQKGNAAIAGHRTTYAAPFNRIDELGAGDEIQVTTAQGSFLYRYSGTQIVAPSQVEVLNDFGDNRLTLTACHPKGWASQRIVVTATLVGPVAPSEAAPAEAAAAPEELPGDPEELPRDPEPRSLDGAGLSGEGASALPAVALGVACAIIWVAAWLLGRAWRKWPAYAACLPIFLVALFYFFENFARLLPGNY